MIGDSETYPCMDVIKHIYKCDDHFYQILANSDIVTIISCNCGNDILPLLMAQTCMPIVVLNLQMNYNHIYLNYNPTNL